MVNKNVKVALFGLVMLLGMFSFSLNTKASSTDKKATMDAKGNITYKTEDRTATNPVRYGTTGICVEPYKTKGVPNYKTNGKLKYKSKNTQVVSESMGGITYTTYTFKDTDVEKVFEKSGVTSATLKDTGNKVYLNFIHEVRYYDSNTNKLLSTRGPFYTLNGIKEAEPWIDNSGFAQRFDVELDYPVKVPV